MAAAGWRVPFVVSVPKTQLLEDAPRGIIIGVVTGEEFGRSQRSEGVTNDGFSGLGGVTLPLVTRPDVKAELERPLPFRRDITRAEAAASHEVVVGEPEDRPVLDAVVPGFFDFRFESFPDPDVVEQPTD